MTLSNFHTWRAHDGNGSADYDQDGQPIILGAWYVEAYDHDEKAHVIIAGPFETQSQAIHHYLTTHGTRRSTA
jgi:hypothetical protein